MSSEYIIFGVLSPTRFEGEILEWPWSTREGGDSSSVIYLFIIFISVSFGGIAKLKVKIARMDNSRA